MNMRNQFMKVVLVSLLTVPILGLLPDYKKVNERLQEWTNDEGEPDLEKLPEEWFSATSTDKGGKSRRAAVIKLILGLEDKAINPTLVRPQHAGHDGLLLTNLEDILCLKNGKQKRRCNLSEITKCLKLITQHLQNSNEQIRKMVSKEVEEQLKNIKSIPPTQNTESNVDQKIQKEVGKQLSDATQKMSEEIKRSVTLDIGEGVGKMGQTMTKEIQKRVTEAIKDHIKTLDFGKAVGGEVATNMKQRIDTYKAEHQADLEKQKKELEKIIASTTDSFVSKKILNDEKNKLDSKFDELAVKVGTNTAMMTSQSQRIDACDKSLDECSSKLTEANSKVEKLTTTVATHTEKIESQSKKIEDCKTKIEECNTQLIQFEQDMVTNKDFEDYKTQAGKARKKGNDDVEAKCVTHVDNLQEKITDYFNPLITDTLLLGCGYFKKTKSKNEKNHPLANLNKDVTKQQKRREAYREYVETELKSLKKPITDYVKKAETEAMRLQRVLRESRLKNKALDDASKVELKEITKKGGK